MKVKISNVTEMQIAHDIMKKCSCDQYACKGLVREKGDVRPECFLEFNECWNLRKGQKNYACLMKKFLGELL